MVLLILSTTPQLHSSACVHLHLPQSWKCKQNSILYECSLQYTVSSVNLAVPEVARRQHHRRTDNVIDIHTNNEYFCVVWRRYQWLRLCSVGDRLMNTETDEKKCSWTIDGSMVTGGNRTERIVVTNDQSEAFLNSVQHKFLVEELLAPRPKPMLEYHACRLSETGYAIHLQLPSV
jgi:hypothetical protein